MLIEKITVLADSDTRWKWGALVARRIAPEARLDACLLRGRATPTARQLGELGIPADSMREVTATEFLAAHAPAAAPAPVTPDGPAAAPSHDHPDTPAPASAAVADVIVLACVGGTVQAMLHGLARGWAAGGGRRPVVVTGYVGVVYEKLADGLLLRHGADVVLANSASDVERFRAVYEGVGADPECVVESALPFLGGARYEPAGRERPFTVVLAVQPSVPESRRDREYLLRRVAQHAHRHADRRVVVKLRSRPGEHTTHVEENPFAELAARMSLPANVELSYGHMSEVLDGTDLLVTVSSTAALESMHRGIPTAVLTDLGVREALGNHHFLGSGALVSWDELDDGVLPRVDEEWLRRNGAGAGGDPFLRVRERVADLVDRSAVGRLAPPRPYYTRRTAPGYLPGVLARHGLDADAAPTAAVPPRPPGALRRAVRELNRNVARAAYRHAVQRVAPAVRRWGQL